MNRRTLLGAVAGLTTGCLGTDPRALSPTGESPSRVRERPSGTDESPTDTARQEQGVEYRLTDLAVSASTDRPDAEYALEPTAFYSADAVESEREDSAEPVVVMDVSEVEDTEARTAVETALRKDSWRSDALPEDLADLVERVDFFTGVPSGATHTHVGLTLYRLHPDQPSPVAVDATVLDAQVSPGSPGAVEFALVNEGEQVQEVFSGTVPPFGLVRAEQGDGSGQFLLWRDYGEEGCVSFTEDGLLVCDVGKLTTLEPGQRVARQYEVLPSSTGHHPDYTAPPGPGLYRVDDELSYSPASGAPGSTLSFEVTFDLEPA